jgi:hypothetical protein
MRNYPALRRAVVVMLMDSGGCAPSDQVEEHVSETLRILGPERMQEAEEFVAGLRDDGGLDCDFWRVLCSPDDAATTPLSVAEVLDCLFEPS